MFTRIKNSIKYFKGIRSNKNIPMLYISIDLTKANTEKNCEVNFLHPSILTQLSMGDELFLKEHLGLIVDKIRDNVDFNK